MPLLKTCQTCHRAKIRCDRTQDSGSCDRCLRLNKTCIFASARRGVIPAQVNRQRVSSSTTRNFEPSRSVSPAASVTVTDGYQNDLSSIDPFQGGLLDWEHGERLLATFRLKMVPHFPFVIIPESLSLDYLRQVQPALCLAILAATSFNDPRLQRRLGNRFNHLVGTRMTKGQFATLDMLQGLLVSLAWAHYQPRPRRYTQHLHLAISIVSDMRLDRPKNSRLWSIGDKYSEKKHDGWSSEELRALLGTYYLASSSSTILQKSGYFRCTGFILESSQLLGERGEARTDKVLNHLIHLQQLSEEIDDTRAESSLGVSQDHRLAMKITAVRNKLELLKATLTFPLSDCPTALLHSNTLETLLNQSPSQSHGMASSPAEAQRAGVGETLSIKYLSESITCVKSLISVIIVFPPGEEFTMTNLSWIMLYRGLSLAVKLDLATVSDPLAQLTEHLHRLLDLRHTLRQIVLRLESAISPTEDDSGDRDTFYHLCHRARLLEKWYLEHQLSSTNSQPGSSTDTHLSMETPAEMDTDMTMRNIPQFVFSEAVGPDMFFGDENFGRLSTTGLDLAPDDAFGMNPDQFGDFGQ